MSAEVAVNLPFDSAEIKSIAVEEFKKRLEGLSPLMGMKEYASFNLKFEVKITVFRAGETGVGKDTMAWGDVKGGSPSVSDTVTTDELTDSFISGDPNQEREDRGMEMTVETGDGHGGKVRKKVMVR